MADQVQPNVQADQGRPLGPPAPPRTAAPSSGGGGGGSPFRIAKPGQGIHVRWGTALGGLLLAFGGATFSWSIAKRFTDNEMVLRLVPVVFLVGLAYLIFRLVGRHAGVIDFLIATEGEMKKVNWSSKKEVWGATKVVIVTVLALAFILAFVDVVFIGFFSGIGVLKINIMSEFFRGQGS
jgi:preprotein translocase subunit SecE